MHPPCTSWVQAAGCHFQPSLCRYQTSWPQWKVQAAAPLGSEFLLRADALSPGSRYNLAAFQPQVGGRVCCFHVTLCHWAVFCGGAVLALCWLYSTCRSVCMI